MGYKKLSNEQELQLVQEYINGANVETLRVKYGFATRKSVTDKVKKYYPNEWEDIKKKNHEIGKGYSYKLEKIENEFDAYFLGLLLTDGYICTGGGAVGIDLVDEDCIKFLSTIIGKDYKTYECTDRQHEYEGRIISDRQDRHRLVLHDKELVENLKRFGVTEHKTQTLQGPILLKEEEQFIPYIVRGIIDGDGNIDIANNHVGIRITSKSYDFALWLKNILEQKMYLKNVCIAEKKNLFVVETYLTSNILKIISLSYDKSYGMQRKYKKIREMFRDYNKDFLEN